MDIKVEVIAAFGQKNKQESRRCSLKTLSEVQVSSSFTVNAQTHITNTAQTPRRQ